VADLVQLVQPRADGFVRDHVLAGLERADRDLAAPGEVVADGDSVAVDVAQHVVHPLVRELHDAARAQGRRRLRVFLARGDHVDALM
jgi:hypothetical protein